MDRKKLLVFIFICFIFNINNFVFAKTLDLVKYLPSVVQDKKVVLATFKKGLTYWTFSQGSTPFIIKMDGKNVLKVKYNFNRDVKRVYIDYALPPNHFIGERLEFWFKGDGSKNIMEVWSRYKNKWICLDREYNPTSNIWAIIPAAFLKPKIWQHLEIPALPTYLFYKDTTAFRFMIIHTDKNINNGELYIKRILMVKPYLKLKRLPVSVLKKLPPVPVFDFWGGLRSSNKKEVENKINLAKKMGITKENLPIWLFAGRNGQPIFGRGNQIYYISPKSIFDRNIKLFHKADIMVSLDFELISWNENYIDKLMKLGVLLKNEKGQFVTEKNADYFYFSPWNPESIKMIKKRIISVVKYLKKRKLLKDVDAVKIGPGTESEIGFEWTHIWAFDTYAIKAYQEYLRKFYHNNVKALNHNWGTNYLRFNTIQPPHGYRPDTRHWVFEDFYRLSMLKWCVELADAVESAGFTPKYWEWLPHSITFYPARFFTARCPFFYSQYLKQLGILDYAHMIGGSWDTTDDVRYINHMGIVTMAEEDVQPNMQTLKKTFEDAKNQHDEGVFLGWINNFFSPDGKLNRRGKEAKKLIKRFIQRYTAIHNKNF